MNTRQLDRSLAEIKIRLYCKIVDQTIAIFFKTRDEFYNEMLLDKIKKGD